MTTNIIELAEKKALIERDPEVMRGRKIINTILQTEIQAIKDDAQEMQFNEMLLQSKEVQVALENRRRFFTDPLESLKKSIKNGFDLWIKPVKDKEIEIKNAIAKWRMHKAEEAHKIQERAEKEQKRLEARLEKKGMTDISVPAFVTPKREKITRSESGSVGERKTWKVEVIDILALARAVADKQVPENCIMERIGNLQSMARNGVTEIPGCRVYQESGISTRRG